METFKRYLFLCIFSLNSPDKRLRNQILAPIAALVKGNILKDAYFFLRKWGMKSKKRIGGLFDRWMVEYMKRFHLYSIITEDLEQTVLDLEREEKMKRERSLSRKRKR